jgi:putative acetyltransferase
VSVAGGAPWPPHASFEVARTTLHDVPGFVAVVAAVAEERRWILTEPPVDVARCEERIRAALATGNDALWSLREHTEIVGTVGLHATPAAGVSALGMCLVAPARGRGGGELLLRTALAHARETGLAKVELEVWPDNARAVALYARHGFVVEGLRRQHYLRSDGSRWDSLLMAVLL